MALAEDGGLETFSTVLTKDQVRRMRRIKDARSSNHKRVSLADVARDVVEAGLVVISLGQNIGFSASESSDIKSSEAAA